MTAKQPVPTHNRATTLAIGAAVWLTSIVTVLAWIGVYSNTPNAPGQPPEHWPAQSQISPDPDRPTLMMFVHPRCPCSRASLDELARLLVQERGLGRTHLVFINPTGKSAAWAQTDLWRQAARVPGLVVHLDQDGVEAQRFGVATSGQTLLYAASGALVFRGGITISRGYSGDNPGRTAVLDLLAHKVSPVVKTPTFGCPLFAVACAKGEALCQP